MIAVDLIVLVPLASAVMLGLSGGRGDTRARNVGFASVLAQGLCLLIAASSVASGPVTGATGQSVALWSLAFDGLSAPLVALTVVTGLVAVAASWRITERRSSHFALILLVQAAVACVFLAADVVLLYVAWETVLIPMFLLIGGWGSSDRRRAAMKFLIYTFAGGALLLVGIVLASASAGSTMMSDVHVSPGPFGTLVFWLMALGFLVKVPAVPLHTWLPDAHTEAPTAGSVLLAGVLLKMGGYGLIRLAAPAAPAAFTTAAPVLIALGVIGVVWGAGSALVQTDLKRLVAYSSVSHMGFVLIAIGVGTPESLGAALLVMVSHGLIAPLLFFLVGALYERTHTRELSAFGGLGTVAPRWSVVFVFGCLASAGLPALSGFPGELVTTLSASSVLGWWMLVLLFGVVLAAAYNLVAVRRTVQGPVGGTSAIDDLTPLELVTSAGIAVLVLALGLAPWIVTSAASRVVESVVATIAKGA